MPETTTESAPAAANAGNGVRIRYEYNDGVRDWYSWTCEYDGWTTLIPEGADVAECPRCIGRECDADAEAEAVPAPAPSPVPAPWTADRILKLLRANAEDETAPGWRLVYLDNARPSDVSPHAFAGFLSVLQGRGVYEPYDNFAWGVVKMKEA